MSAKRNSSSPEDRAYRGNLRRLYAAANDLRALAPWRWMDDDQLIGVEEPASGAVGYACVMGALGTLFGLAVYRGAGGYLQHQRLYAGEIEPEDSSAQLTQDCLLATFEDRSDLTDRDLRELRSTGLRVRGRKAWPMFRSSKPGYAPWYLDPPEVELLCIAVEQAIEVCRRTLAGEAPRSPGDPDVVLVRRFDQAGAVWCDSWQRPADPPPSPAPPQPDAATIARLLKQKRPGGPIAEVQLIHLMAPISDGSRRPYFPRTWLCADARTGVVAISELMEPERSALDMQDAFMAVFNDRVPLPSEIMTSDSESYALLAPVADALGVRLRRRSATPRLEEAREAMDVMLRGGATGDVPWAD